MIKRAVITKAATLMAAVVCATFTIDGVQALVLDQPEAPTVQATNDQAAVQALAGNIRTAIDAAKAALPADADEAAQRAAVVTAVQEVIVTAGASPINVLSAINAVRSCATGAASSANAAGPPGLVSVVCSPTNVSALDQPTLLALGDLEGRVLALIEGEQPAALSGGFFGGLNVPASAGLTSGGSDYVS